MRTNYQYTAVTGESWLRAKRIVIENPLNGIPTAKFVEERVVNIAEGEQYFRDQGVLEVTTSEANITNEIPLLDPETGEPTGQVVTYGEVYALLFSAYIHFADLRDNPPEPEPVEEPLPEEPPAPEVTTDGGTV